MSKADQPAFFPNAQNPIINGGVFAAVQGNAYFSTSTLSISERRGMKLLLENIAPSAFHDAAERGDPPKCHKETRKSIIAEILDWIDKTNKWYNSLLWLNGPAGAGKSAIMQTIAELCALREYLVGSFFFDRTAPERNNSTRFVATLAYQLALAVPQIQERVVDAVEADPTIFTRKLVTQADVLIVQPMKVLLDSSSSSSESGATLPQPTPRVFVIDALDECAPASQREVIECIAKIVDNLAGDWNHRNDDNPSLLFVLSSRPEYEFRQAFSWDKTHWLDYSFCLSSAIKVKLEPNYDADLDIELFLRATFQKIKDTHPVRAHIPEDWPTEQQLRYLVDTSSSQFIYAATAARYIDSPRHNPLTRLDVVLKPGNTRRKETPFSQLDALYRLVLGSVADLPVVMEVLTFLVLRTSKLTVPNIHFISTLYGLDQLEVRLALTDMYALMNVPSTDNDTGDILRLHHASMVDFLTDRARAGESYINIEMGHSHLAASYISCLQRLEETKSTDLYDAMITGFFTHYSQSQLTDDLQWALDNFHLERWLPEMTMAQFYNTNWSDLFTSLKEKVTSRDTVFPEAVAVFDYWVRRKLDQYPDILQICIPAAYTTFPQHFLNLIAPIFSIVMARRPDTEAVKLLDSELFNFQDQEQNTIASLAEFFNDHTRAGRYFPTEASFKFLAKEITENIFPKIHDPKKTLRIHAWLKGWSKPYNQPYKGHEDGVISLHHRSSNLHFFSQILERCPKDIELGMFFRDRVLQVEKRTDDRPRDYARIGRVNLGKAGLQYVKDCGISYSDHEHIGKLSLCIICNDLKAKESSGSDSEF